MKEIHPQTCIASARLSSHQQVGGDSLERQVFALESFAKSRNWQLLPEGKVFEEVNSATKRRKLYDYHIQYIKDNPGKVGYYLIPNIDRFSRGGSAVYEDMKKELADLDVVLVDTNGVIQEAKNMDEMDILGFRYGWSVSSTSEITESVLSTHAKVERDTILRRTIPKQIAYTQRGFQIGRPDDGYVNQKIVSGTQVRFIQAPDPERANYFRKIFELRAENKLTDQEILSYVNDKMGFRTKVFNRWNKEQTAIVGQSGGKRLTIKQLQRIYQRFSYSGVICEKWTHDKPIRAQWEGLVSIELWNQANRGKIFLKEYPDGSLEVLYNYKLEKPTFQRLRYNPEFPFKCVCCPECGAPLKGSAPKGREKYYPQYHCSRGHKSFSVSAEQMQQTIADFVSSLDYDETYLNVLKSVMLQKLRQRQADILKESKVLNERVAMLKDKKSRTVEAYVRATLPTTQDLLEKEIANIEIEVKRAESYRLSVDLTEYDIEEMVICARKMVERPERGIIDTKNPLRQKRLFQLFFEDLPTYAELNSGTAKKRFLFNRNCIVETPTNSRESHQGHVLSLGWNQLQNFCLGWLSAVRKALTNFVQNVQYINENNYYYRSKKKNC